MGLSRRQFTKEFKLAAVRRLEQGVSIGEAARALEVNPTVLHRWRREFRQGPGNVFPGNGKPRWSEGRIAKPSRCSGPISAMLATATELTLRMRSMLSRTGLKKTKWQPRSARGTFRKRELSTGSRSTSNARFVRPVPTSWSQAVDDRKENEFRLHPRRPRAAKTSSPRVWSTAYIQLVYYVRRMRARKRGARAGPRTTARPYHQRCAVRVVYSKNTTRGQWKAHGRYIARESATQGRVGEAGFDAVAQGVNIAARLDQWQSAGDERLWKLIVSPEFGDQMNLLQLTRDLMKRMARDLGTHLEWVAVAHFNTDNPHVHIALRGVRDDGHSLRLGSDYVKYGIRRIAEDLCTRQLGYRTQSDVSEARRREVSQHRFTSLDRAIAQDRPRDGKSSHFTVHRNSAQRKNQYVVARLQTLQEMQLAAATGPDQWVVRQIAIHRPSRVNQRRAMALSADRNVARSI
jgi:transposase-like protein